VLSPLLGNVYLHYVLDQWFDREVKPRLRGEAFLVRYADDFVMTFELQGDAERVMDVLSKRMGRFGHPFQGHRTGGTRIASTQKPGEKPGNQRKGAEAQRRKTPEFLSCDSPVFAPLR